MSRIATPPSIEAAPAASQPFLRAVKTQLGSVPNMFRVIANSPAALEGYLGLNGALAKGSLDPKTRQRIALAVAQVNGCDYCLAAHSYLGKTFSKLDDAELEDLSRLVLKAKPRQRSSNQIVKPSVPKKTRKRGADVSVIQGYMSRLRAAYRDDSAFETLAVEIANDSDVSKDDVAKLFNEFFDANKSFAPKRTKAERVEDLRRERINRIRFDAA